MRTHHVKVEPNFSLHQPRDGDRRARGARPTARPLTRPLLHRARADARPRYTDRVSVRGASAGSSVLGGRVSAEKRKPNGLSRFGFAAPFPFPKLRTAETAILRQSVFIKFSEFTFSFLNRFKPRQTDKRAQALGCKSLLYGKVEGRRELARIKPYIFSRDATSRLLTVGTCLASPARAVFTGCPGPAWRRRP